MRKDPLTTKEYYHIVTRSIAQFKIFNNDADFKRMLGLFQFYQHRQPPLSYSRFMQLPVKLQTQIKQNLSGDVQNHIVRIVAFCLMPTHIHFLLQQLQDNGISRYMSNLLNSYTRFFNITHKRKGPLWESRFKNILVKDNDQLLHLTRYIHLNPTSARLIENPQEWQWSSYREYLLRKNNKQKIVDYSGLFNLSPKQYQDFVTDRIHYQKELSQIKSLLLENYTG